MNDVIRADYPTLAQVSQRLVAQAEALVDMQQVVVRIEKKLQTGGWIGLGSEAFVDEMAGEVLPALQRLIDALRQAGASTQAMAKLIGDAEEAAASPFREETALSSRPALADGGTGAPSGGGQEPNAGTDNAGDGISDQSSSHPNGGSNPDQSATTAEGSIGPDIGVMTPDDGGGSDIGGGTGPGDTIGEGSSAGDSGRAGDLGIPGEWGIPGDWLDGIRDYGGMLPGQSEWGIPYDWLDGVYAAIETGPEAEFIDPLAEVTEESSGVGGGGGGSQEEASSGSGGGGSGDGGGEEPTGEPAGSPVVGGGSGSVSGFPRGGFGGDSFDRGDYTTRVESPTDAEEAAIRPPLRFQGVGGTGALDAGATARRDYVHVAAFAAETPAPKVEASWAAALLALSPLAALLGKAVRERAE